MFLEIIEDFEREGRKVRGVGEKLGKVGYLGDVGAAIKTHSLNTILCLLRRQFASQFFFKNIRLKYQLHFFVEFRTIQIINTIRNRGF